MVEQLHWHFGGKGNQLSVSHEGLDDPKMLYFLLYFRDQSVIWVGDVVAQWPARHARGLGFHSPA